MAFRRSNVQNATYLGVSRAIGELCAMLVDGRLRRQEFLERCTRVTNASIGCSRTGIWIFLDTAEGQLLRCLAMYDAITNSMKKVPDERRDIQPYFEEMAKSGFVSASEAELHPATAGMVKRPAGALKVRSLLAASFAVNGHLYGAFTCTHVGEAKEWTPRQLATLRQIGAQTSLAMFTSSRSSLTTGHGPLI